MMNKWVMAGFKSLLAAVILVSVFFTIWAIGPSVETSRFPVVGKLTIITAVENPDGFTEIHAAFRKMRDCEYIGIQWFKVNADDGSFVRIPVELLREEGDTTSPNRPVGYQKAGPWIVHANLEDFQHNTFATLTHRCHPFWMTTTNFYP